MGIERIIARRVGRGKPLRQSQAGPGLGACRTRIAARVGGHFVGLFVCERRLMRHGGGKGGILAHRIVHAEAGAHHGLLGKPQSQTQPRRKGETKRKDERIGKPRSAGLYLGLAGESPVRVGRYVSQVAKLLGVWCEELITHAVVQREPGQHAPVVHGEGVEDVVAQVALVHCGVDGGLLRQSQQKIRQRRATGGRSNGARPGSLGE